MISKVLIANRGEIVARVIKTCREMGIGSAAVYSEADDNAPYLKAADSAVAIGPANPVQSYLNMDAVINAAKSAGADAIHPGYGFLSERGQFAKAVEEAGITWVGPPADVLKAISSKVYCRKVAHRVGVPVTPGTLGIVASGSEIVDYGNTNGWPLLLKLDKGGGGKGIERIDGPQEVEEVFKRATSIGKMAFGSGNCYLETLVNKPRHIEVQFLADKMGQVVCLGERECSVQRRHQKIIEETRLWWSRTRSGQNFSSGLKHLSKRSDITVPEPLSTCVLTMVITILWKSMPASRWNIRSPNMLPVLIL